MRKISGASCWLLKLKEVSIDVDIFCCSTRKKLDGSTGDVERFNKDMLRATDLTKGETQGCSEADCDHKGGIALNACRIELA